jgi:hypothetical protein
MRVLERFEATGLEHGYESGGSRGRVEFSVPASSTDALQEMLSEVSAGALTAQPLGSRVVYRSPGPERG